MSYMGQTGLDAQKGADILSTAIGKYTSTVEYPKTTIGASLKGIAQVKLAGPRDAGLLHLARQLRHPRQPAPTHALLWKDVSEAVRRSSPTCGRTTRPTTSSC